MQLKQTRRFGTLALLVLTTLHLPFITAHAQSTSFTYQGRVTDNGTNFTGTGQFEFAMVSPINISQQAYAVLDNIYGGLNNWYFTSVNVYFGGSGYVTPPLVTIPGATATATISGGVVTAISTSGGGPYNMLPSVIIDPPPANIVNATLWSNDGTTSGQPAAAVSVGVTNGLFTLVLGDTTVSNMTAIPASLFSQFSYPNLLLQIWFNDGVHGFTALNPPQALTPAPVAVFANTASNLLGTLPTSQLTGTVPATSLSGSVPAASLTTVPAASLTGSVPAASLTSVPAGSLTGSVVDGRLSANVALRAGGNAFTGSQTITSGTVGITLAGSYAFEMTSNGVAHLTLDSSGNLECSGTVYSKGVALTSDRNSKENFKPLNSQTVLAKVAALPVTQWNYKTDQASVQHIGPMAQDFQAAFGLDGADDKHISVVDEGGVALAAIQGLNQKVEEKDSTIQQQSAEIADLKARLERLETMLLQNPK